MVFAYKDFCDFKKKIIYSHSKESEKENLRNHY